MRERRTEFEEKNSGVVKINRRVGDHVTDISPDAEHRYARGTGLTGGAVARGAPVLALADMYLRFPYHFVIIDNIVKVFCRKQWVITGRIGTIILSARPCIRASLSVFLAVLRRFLRRRQSDRSPTYLYDSCAAVRPGGRSMFLDRIKLHLRTRAGAREPTRRTPRGVSRLLNYAALIYS